MSVARRTYHHANQTSLVDKTIRRAQILCNELGIGVPGVSPLVAAFGEPP